MQWIGWIVRLTCTGTKPRRITGALRACGDRGALAGVVAAACLVGIAALLCSAAPASAAEQTGFLHRVYRDDAGDHKYVLFVPRAYTPQRQWPIIVYLHGAGERGTDGVRQTEIGLGPFVKKRSDSFPFLVLFPQAEDAQGRLLNGWLAESPDASRMLKILESVESAYRVNPERRILTGWSMGGYGTWSIGAAHPDRWAALVPIAGGGDPAWAEKLHDLPVWAFHGADDAVVRPEESRRIIAALRVAGGRPRHTEVPQAGHDAWALIYDNSQLYEWMQSPASVDTLSPLLVRPGRPAAAAAATDDPFLPALDIENALCVHIGNDALKAVADSVPHVVSADLLSGRIGDIYQTTSTEGYTFGVTFTRIGYRGELARAHARAYRPGRLNIQLGLRNVSMTIGATYVRGSGRSAVAGPIRIVMGHRRPVWLSVDVLPYVEGRRLKMKLLATRFELSPDNWSVSSPAGVSTQGLGMTRERVASGLVSGIYENRARIENEVRAIVPSLLPQLEDRLALDRVADLVESVWPLPVYRPRVRVWPQSVVTDQRGVTLFMGVTAAAVDPRHAPPEPRRISLADAEHLANLPRGDELSVGLAGGILEPLSDLLIRADIARVHVLDIPEKSFVPLAQRSALEQVIPDLARFPETAEIWTELILQQPIQVRDAGTARESESATRIVAAPGGEDVGGTDARSADTATAAVDANPSVRQAGSSSADGASSSPVNAASDAGSPENGAPVQRAGLQFDIPGMVVSMAVRADRKAGQWQPLAEFDLSLSQQVTGEVLRPGFGRRELRLDWVGDPRLQVTARFAPGYEASDARLHPQTMRQLFLDAWSGWTRSGPVSDIIVDDLDFGYTALRLKELEWAAPVLQARFDNPGVKITNASDVPLVYETRGPYSSWGGPYTLEPGRSHEYDVAYPVLYRRRTDSTYRMFTLPVGSHSEFRAGQEGGPPQLYSVTPE